MKVTTQKSTFNPITITIESAEEQDILLNIFDEAARSVRPMFFKDHKMPKIERTRDDGRKMLNMANSLFDLLLNPVEK